MKKRSFLVMALSLMLVLCLVLSIACKKVTENTISFEIDIEGYTGEGIANQTVATGSSLTLPAAPEVQNYQFEHWKLGTEQYAVGDTYKVEVDGDITFTAVYAKAFVFTYSVAQGQTAPQAVNGKVGEQVTLANGSNNGYSEFKCWVINGTEYQAGAKYTPVQGANTATARYTDTFVLSYSVDEGLEAPAGASGEVGEEITLANGSNSGYREFKSWVINGTEYAAGAKYTPVLGANLVTALYTDTFVLSYSVDEGLEAPTAAAGDVGEEVTLAEGPQKADYEFKGWKIGETVYEAGAKYSPALGAITATAQYERTHVYVTFEIDQEYSDINGEVGNAVRLAIGNTLEESDIPELSSNKEFYGIVWFNGANEVDLSQLAIEQDVTITAKSAYVGTDANAFIFTAVKAASESENEEAETIGYTVMASEDYAQYVTNGRLGIPAKHEGLPVLGTTACTASEPAFGSTAAAGLQYVYLPACIKAIDHHAFYDNSTLTTVIYEEGTQLETIGVEAFCGCTALTTLSDSVDNAGLRFPASVKTIGTGAFKAVSLNRRSVNIYFDAANGVLETIGADAFRSNGTTTAKLSGFTINTAFPATLQSVGTYAFHANLAIGRVDFGENATITTIGDYAFGQHSVGLTPADYTLTELVIPKSVTSLGMHAFQNNQSLEYVEFEEGSPITVLREYVFDRCYALEEVILPAGLTTIENHAFSDSFKNANDGAGIALNGANGKFVIPAGVTVYGTNVFSGSNFSEVTIPAAVTEIGDNAFLNAVIGSLTFAEGGVAGLTIGVQAFSTQYLQTALTIPARVTSIDALAFWKANLTALNFEQEGTLPLEIKDKAFSAYMKSNPGGTSPSASLSTSDTIYPFTATSVTIPARTTSIGKMAFYAQFKLQQVNFAQGCSITEIPDYAFAYCIDLRAINIPASVTSIGQYAYTLYGMNNVKETVYNEGEAVNATHTNADIYIDITSITIPAAVESIGVNAFFNRGLKLSSLVFEGTAANNDLTIGNFSFGILESLAKDLDKENEGNVALTSVTFPANLVSVGGLFVNAAGSTSMYLNMATVNMDACTRLTTLGDNFMLGNYLTSVSIPASVTTIGNNVFANKIVANGTITKTTKYTGKVTLPAGLTSLGAGFCAGTGVTEFEIADTNANFKTVDGVLLSKDGTKLINYPFGNTATSYKVPDGCTTIADGALKSNEKLTSIDFNDVTTIEGTYGLANTALTSIDHSFVTLGNYTFFKCNSLTTVNINITGTTVPTYLFQNCEELTTVTLGANIVELGNWSLGGCKKLKTVNVSENLTKIGMSVFNGCIELESIDLSHVTNLGNNAFQGCSKLASVKLGAITTIGVNTFASTNLTSLTLSSETVVSLGGVNAFTGYSNEKVLTIYVPSDLIASYQAAANWSTLLSDGKVAFAAIQTETTGGEETEGGETEGGENQGEVTEG